MSHRFFVPGLDPGAREVTLPPEEARHLGRVLRLPPGARVIVFDGRGGEWEAELLDVKRDRATVRVGAPRLPAPETRAPIVLLAGVLKGEKMDDVVRDAVMLGIAGIRPVVTARTEVSVASLARGRRAERWRRLAVASAKQCGRAVVPPVAEPVTLEEAWAGATEATRLMLVEPSAGAIRAVGVGQVPRADIVELLVGPEGGWTDDEQRWAEGRGATGLRLGGRTLRADAAPLVAVTALQAVWGDL